MSDPDPSVLLGGTARAADGRPTPRRAVCVIGEYCRRHMFVHGAEAEELRSRLERIGDLPSEVRRILDDVDARDSLAWLEHRTAEGR